MHKSFLTLFLWMVLSFSCQRKNVPTSPPLVFPMDYVGEWAGELEIMKEGQTIQRVPMEWHLGPLSDSSHTWTLIYGPEQNDVRKYTLRMTDPSTGRFDIDENNGIILPLQQFGERLISWFEVQGQTLFIAYELQKNEIIFTVDVKSSTTPMITGDTIIGSDTIPQVTGFPLLLSQRARLVRKKA